MNADTVTVKEVKAASARLDEIIALHAPEEITTATLTTRWCCRECTEVHPCPTVKLATRARRSLTGVVA